MTHPNIVEPHFPVSACACDGESRGASRAQVRPGPPELVPVDPLQISAQMRLMLGRSTFRNPSDQVEAEGLLGVLARELQAKSTLQMLLVQRLSGLFIEIRQLRSAVATAVTLQRPAAAREIVTPGFNHFYPAAASTTQTVGAYETAYGAFMSGGGEELAKRDDARVIAEALSVLATNGMREEALNEVAYILALPTIERLERLIATKHGEEEALIEQLLRMIDRQKRIIDLQSSKELTSGGC